MRASTADFLAYHAAAQPEAVALIRDGVGVTYDRFWRDLNRVTRTLAGFGLARGAIVAVECGNDYLHWLILLACERLALVSASYAAEEAPAPASLLAKADLVLHRRPLPAAAVGKARSLDESFMGEVRAASDAPLALPPVAFGDGRRVRRSSGTTGAPKAMVATGAQQEADIRSNAYHSGFTAGTRLLIYNNFSIGALYNPVTAVLRQGGCVIADWREAPARIIARYRPTHLRVLVGEAVAILELLPADFPKPAGLILITGGSPLLPALRRRLLDRLADEVIEIYATNESMRLAVLDGEGIGALVPGVRLEIAEGEIRVRTQAMVAGYLDDPEATRRMFRDGWFHPGDLAEWVGPRRIRLAGRGDEMIQRGGAKILPATIEAEVRAAAPVKAVAATALRNADGIDEVCVALVLEPGQEARTTIETIAGKLPHHLGRVRFRTVAALPVGGSGKVRINSLRALFAEPVALDAAARTTKDRP